MLLWSWTNGQAFSKKLNTVYEELGFNRIDTYFFEFIDRETCVFYTSLRLFSSMSYSTIIFCGSSKNLF